MNIEREHQTVSVAPSDLDRARAEFFRRTRRTTALLYTGLAVAAVGCLVGGIAASAGPALAALVVASLATVALFALSAWIPTSARTARTLIWLAPLAGVIVSSWLDFNPFGEASTPLFLGAMAGLFVGMGVGIASIRRRLARDDDLLRRQQRLGFDPQRPWAWLREK